MKKILFLMMSLYSVLGYAQNIKTYTCKDIYKMTAESKTNLKNTQITGSSTLVVVGATMAIAFPPMALVSAAGVVWSAANLSKSKEEKVLLLQEETSKFHKKLVKHLGEMEIVATNEEIFKVIEEGFNTGRFCENFPALYSKNQVIEYVSSKLKN